jgi:3-oxoacyl-[acyl-carrier protein] reductase
VSTRVALVTGAGRGLGRELAIALAQAGAAVGLIGRTRPGLEETAELLDGTGVPVEVATADVRSWEEVRAAVDELEATLGGADLLVNNAGIIDPVEVPVWEADPHQWREVIETDLLGPFHCVRAVVPGMIARGLGRVVDLNSGAGAADRPIYSAYCAAKAGLFRITGNLHLAGHSRGLRAFEVSPGTVRTDMTAAMATHADRTEWTPADALVQLVLSISRGDLDEWSGAFLRAGVDTPASLLAAQQQAGDAGLSPLSRRLGVFRYGSDDPLPP